MTLKLRNSCRFQFPLCCHALSLTRLSSRNHYVALKFLVTENQKDIDNAADVSKSPNGIPESLNEIEILRHLFSASLRLSHPGSAHVLSLLDHFIVFGPNGSHRVLVTEVTGPRISSLPKSGDVVRDVCRQIVQGVDYLHQQRIGHGGESSMAIHDTKRSSSTSRIGKAEYQKTRFVMIFCNVRRR